MAETVAEGIRHGRRERRALGKAHREAVPRAAHGVWEPAADRKDPIEIIEETNIGRVPELIPIRHGRMLANPFAFFRGSAALMASDLASTPATGIQVQACGDCHLANFGLFATPERNLVFDLNDFDETLPGPWEWDIKRLAVSFVLAGRNAGLSDRDADVAVRVLTGSYRRRLNEYAGMRVLDVWYSRLDDKTLIETAPDAESREFRKRIAARARSSIAEYLFPKITDIVDGSPRIADKPPLIYHLPDFDDINERIKKIDSTYRKSMPGHMHKLLDQYQLVDFAFKVVGVGSVGTRCYVFLLMAGDDDPLFLQVKEARASVLEPYLKKSKHRHHGQRIVVGQRLTQSASDMFLGWLTSLEGHHFYVRQLRDMKYSIPLDEISAKQLARYADVCGWVLARAHARSGHAATIAGYLGKSDAFDDAMRVFARAYADQTAQDYQEFVDAEKTGRIRAEFDY
ncbi:MAG: DUF2252 domain-containing protein [Anaerolineales bacterium]|nr:DUF2252 domain-containing protein [Anaerolineales bacterium]